MEVNQKVDRKEFDLQLTLKADEQTIHEKLDNMNRYCNQQISLQKKQFLTYMDIEHQEKLSKMSGNYFLWNSDFVFV